MPDPMTIAGLVVGAAVSGALVLGYARSRRTKARHAKVFARSGGEPVSLHPKIDEHVCICTAACVQVCPEKDVLGMVDGRPTLLRPSACIGHGECMRACPVEAISLVIGSARRGVELPLLQADFQTNVPGLYIAGELGGMGLIHNAVNQGGQAMTAIARGLQASPASRQDPALLDVLVVGAGPAGLAAGLKAKQLGLRFALVDQEQLGGAIRSFPRQKVVMTAPVDLPLYGKVKLRRTTKEALLELWDEVAKKTGLAVEAPVRVSAIRREGEVFVVEIQGGEPRRARRVLLAVGRRGAPRKLGIPGEGLDKVTYRLLEPEQYRGSRCLVSGGGDMAVETALMLSREPGCQVTLVHRGSAFDRCKPDNQAALEQARVDGVLAVRLETQATEIAPDHVVVRGPGGSERLPNDFVFVCIGGELPTAWLEQMGVHVRTMRGEKLPQAQA